MRPPGGDKTARVTGLAEGAADAQGERHASSTSCLCVSPQTHPRHRNHGRLTVASVHGPARHGHRTLAPSTRPRAANRTRYGALPPPAAELPPAALCWALAEGNAVTGVYSRNMTARILTEAASPRVSPMRSSSSSTRSFRGSCSPTGP